MPKFNFEHAGETSVTSQGQVTIPGPAREATGLAPGTPVYVFMDRTAGHVLLTHRPDSGDLLKVGLQLIEAAERAAKKSRASA